MPKAVFLDFASVYAGDVDASCLELPGLGLDWEWHAATTAGETLARVRDAELVVSNKVVLDADILAACPALKLVCIAATGTNNVDLTAARERGVAVTNVTGYATPSVVQHVFALMLSLRSRLADQQRAARDGRWVDSPFFCVLDAPFRELAGQTLGIVGYGVLGRGVARVAEAFGMRVLLARRPGAESGEGRLPLREMLPQVDALSLHVPLAENTRGLIGASELALMRPHALLINTARGGIVDEAAVADALRRGRLGGAGVDVLAEEPPVNGSPLLAPDIPNLILTPHVAWASREARQRMLQEVAANIAAFYAGEERNRVA